jgi:hypothetical protein
MSIKAMTWVWDNSKQKGAKLLLLLAIADRCDDEGMCYPGHDRLATKARTSKQMVSKHIKELEKTGELTVMIHAGTETAHGKTNRYYLKKYRDSLGITTPDGNRENYKQHDGSLGNENKEGASKTTPQGRTSDTPYTSVDTSDSLSSKEDNTAASVGAANSLSQCSCGSLYDSKYVYGDGHNGGICQSCIDCQNTITSEQYIHDDGIVCLDCQIKRGFADCSDDKCPECDSTLGAHGKCCSCEMVQGRCTKCGANGIDVWGDSGLCVTCSETAEQPKATMAEVDIDDLCHDYNIKCGLDADYGKGCEPKQSEHVGALCEVPTDETIVLPKNEDGMPLADTCVFGCDIFDLREVTYYQGSGNKELSIPVSVCKTCQQRLDELPPQPKPEKKARKRSAKQLANDELYNNKKLIIAGIYDGLGWPHTDTMYKATNLKIAGWLLGWGATADNIKAYTTWMSKEYVKNKWSLRFTSFGKEDMWQTYSKKRRDYEAIPLYQSETIEKPEATEDIEEITDEQLEAAYQLAFRKATLKDLDFDNDTTE